MHEQDYFDLYETEEHLWWFVGMRAITAALLDNLVVQNPTRILDIGCGTGINLQWLERYAQPAAIDGLDFEQTALKFCRARGENRLVQASAAHLPFADEIFDLVTSFDVLVQLPDEKSVAQAIAEMRRVLKPKGIVFVRVAAYQWMRSSHDEAVLSYRRYTLSQIASALQAGGFSVLRKTYANTIPFPLALARRLVLQKIGLASSGSDVKPLPPALEWLNKLLTRALAAEAKFLSRPNARLPFGLSAICVAQKD